MKRLVRWFALVVRSVLRFVAVVALIAYFEGLGLPSAGNHLFLLWTLTAAFVWFGVGLIGPASAGRSRLATAALSPVADLRTGLGWLTAGALGLLTFLGLVAIDTDLWAFWSVGVPFLSLVEVVCLGVLTVALLAAGSVERPGRVALSGLGGGVFLGALFMDPVGEGGLTVLAWSQAGLLAGLLACTRGADRVRQRVGTGLRRFIDQRVWPRRPARSSTAT